MAEPLYFLPGTMCDERLWHPVWAELDNRVECRYVEMPQADNFEGIISALAGQLPATPVNLVGFSLGGYVAGLFASRFPERINRLCMLSSSPEGLRETEHQQRRQTIRWIEQYGYGGIPPKKINHMLHANHQDHPQLTAIISAMDASGGVDKLLSQLKSTTERRSISAPLSQLARPLLFAFGDQDRLFDKAPIWDLAEGRGHIQVRQVAGAGHMLPLETPQPVAALLLQWLEEHG